MKLVGVAALAALAVAATTVPAAAQTATVVLGTATPGGGFARYAAPLVEILNQVEPTLLIEPRSFWKAASSISASWPASPPTRRSRASGGRAAS